MIIGMLPEWRQLTKGLIVRNCLFQYRTVLRIPESCYGDGACRTIARKIPQEDIGPQYAPAIVRYRALVVGWTHPTSYVPWGANTGASGARSVPHAGTKRWLRCHTMTLRAKRPHPRPFAGRCSTEKDLHYLKTPTLPPYKTSPKPNFAIRPG